MDEHIFNRTQHLSVRRQLRKNLTEPERRLWRALRASQLGLKFRRQHGIGAYIVDFYQADNMIVVELDGDSHFVTAKSVAYDKARDDYLRGLGLIIFRFGNNDVMNNLDGVLQVILQQIKSTPP